MSSVYHILCWHPATLKREMPPELEQIAVNLVKSGLLRVENDTASNFTRFQDPYHDISTAFSWRELHDPTLVKLTKAIIAKDIAKFTYSDEILGKVENAVKSLKKQLKKFNRIEYKTEIKLARLLVQSAHPAVIEMIIYERVEVFVSFAHEVGDVMDIPMWSVAGKNSGLQSTDGKKVGIYITSGGDPFAKPDQPNLPYGDGFPAIARLMIIAGQEIGHFSDIMRDQFGRQISRYSADFSGTRAKNIPKISRRKDLENLSLLSSKLYKLGLNKLIDAERYEKLFKEVNKYSFYYFIIWTKMKIINYFFKLKCKNYQLSFLLEAPYDKHFGLQIKTILEDTKFNLAPKADVYRSDDPQQEEAIAVIEALARVPQQNVKWGFDVNKFLMPNLYHFYYEVVIPGCIQALETISKHKVNYKVSSPPFFFNILKRSFWKKRNKPIIHLFR